MRSGMQLHTSVDRRVIAPIETAAENGFHDQVVGGRRGADADADIDLPNGGHIEIGNDEYLLLLIGGGQRAVPQRIARSSR